MLIVKVELHSAITHKITEIARLRIYNDVSGTKEFGNYIVEGYDEDQEFFGQRKITGHPRLAAHVLNLVAKAIRALGHGD